MNKFIIGAAVAAAAFLLTACNAKTDNGSMSEASANVVETTPVSIPTNEIRPVVEDEQANEAQYGNTSGNISNNAFTAQNGDIIYYVLPTHLEYDVQLGDLTKTNADDSVKTVLFSGGRPLCLNFVDGWIYYISSPDGLIYKMREDGTENTLITTADTQSGLMQGYTTQNLSMVETMVVVDDYIYCRVHNNDRTKAIYRINTDSGEVEKLQQLGEITSGFTVYDGWIYYSKNADDTWETYRITTDGTQNTKITDFQIFSTSIVNDKIYYIYGNDVLETKIYCMDLNGSNNKQIADGIMAVKINVVGDWIYFTDTSAIYKVKTDGTEKIKLCDFPSSNFIDMNVVDDWIYLTGNGFNIHKLKTDGSEMHEVK